MKHGVLSKLTVLPHENVEEFVFLRDALVDEHQPGGPTEMHLVEDLAAIIWRKRRVLLAEGAKINAGLFNVKNFYASYPATNAAPFAYGMPTTPTDWITLMNATPEEVLQDQVETKLYRKEVVNLLDILCKGKPNAYQKVLKVMAPDDRESWEDSLSGKLYQPTVEGLMKFINDQLWPVCVRIEQEAIHHDAIKAQAIGEGLQPVQLESLCRYETHLDRKFERSLAMLIKLKELRG